MPVHDGAVDLAGELSPSLRPGGPPSRIRRAETPLRLSSEWIEIVTNIGAGRAAPTVTFED
ncbi:hypothetical protein TNCT6_71760 [Streptomyces sp. 6-11-2]|nr:hypothetical protein TNCT6_71760 [Streptomyces sp. 6-11-2]